MSFRIFRPAILAQGLTQAFDSIEGLFRQIMPAPFRLKDFATADLPNAADYAQGLVWDSTASKVKWSDGSNWITPPTLAENQTWTGNQTFAGNTTFSGIMLQTGHTSPARFQNAVSTSPGGSGIGLEIVGAASGNSGLQAFNRTSAVYSPLTLDGSTVSLRPAGTAALVASSIGVAVTGTLSCSGNATLGDASGDAHTVTGSLSVSNGISSTTNINATTGFRSTGFAVGSWSGAGCEFGYSAGLGVGFAQAINRTGGATLPFSVFASAINLTADTDVTGLLRCDTFRLDASPTAAVVAQSHHVPININGTVYKLLLAS